MLHYNMLTAVPMDTKQCHNMLSALAMEPAQNPLQCICLIYKNNLDYVIDLLLIYSNVKLTICLVSESF